MDFVLVRFVNLTEADLRFLVMEAETVGDLPLVLDLVCAEAVCDSKRKQTIKDRKTRRSFILAVVGIRQ